MGKVKQEHLIITVLAILACVLFTMLFSGCDRTCPVEPAIVTVVDTALVKELKAELRKARKDLYWQRKRTDSLRIQCHEKDAIIDNGKVFKKTRFERIRDEHNGEWNLLPIPVEPQNINQL